ncbi:NUDIX hydrolase domain-like protein [Ampelomyces quisqualis]|uniref:NUDIX hydrolase domain-like protein n=1 Tax=Ampelomyces quisqualis TaxID=50730 RepID=A0A6A5QCZ2_AMPQU|nr:NUDIX hydrolase domain-like protein [Ampelomyces quisqualis]
MAKATTEFQYPASLQEYAIDAAAYLRQHVEYDVMCTGVVVFNKDGKLLLVQRAADEKAFPNMWEIPGGKIDDTDETLLHAAVRELNEETGLTATRVRRKVADFTFEDGRPGGPTVTWLKLIFEVEVEDLDVTLNPAEHQQYLFASEEEVVSDLVGDTKLVYISPPNKRIKLDAFRLQKEAITGSSCTTRPTQL